MTTTADVDRQVTDHIADLIRRDECFESIGEIADQLAISVTHVRGSIKRLVGYGEVRAAGVASNGAKTWTLTNPPRDNPAAAGHHARPATEHTEETH